MDSAAKQMSKQLVGDFKPTTDGQKAIVKACEKLSGKKFSELTIAELRDHLANAAKSGLPVDDIMDVSHKVANFVKDRKPPKDKLPENKGTDMNFPKLQALTEAKKKKVEDEMEMDFGDASVGQDRRDASDEELGQPVRRDVLLEEYALAASGDRTGNSFLAQAIHAIQVFHGFASQGSRSKLSSMTTSCGWLHGPSDGSIDQE